MRFNSIYWALPLFFFLFIWFYVLSIREGILNFSEFSPEYNIFSPQLAHCSGRNQNFSQDLNLDNLQNTLEQPSVQYQFAHNFRTYYPQYINNNNGGVLLEQSGQNLISAAEVINEPNLILARRAVNCFEREELISEYCYIDDSSDSASVGNLHLQHENGNPLIELYESSHRAIGIQENNETVSRVLPSSLYVSNVSGFSASAECDIIADELNISPVLRVYVSPITPFITHIPNHYNLIPNLRDDIITRVDLSHLVDLHRDSFLGDSFSRIAVDGGTSLNETQQPFQKCFDCLDYYYRNQSEPELNLSGQ